MKIIKTNLSQNSILSNGKFDFCDCYQGILESSKKIDILHVCKSFFSTAPNWVEKLFLLRNKIVKWFGLKIPNEVTDRKEALNNFKGNVGEQLGLFKVFDKNENEIIFGENDKHLDFRVSFFLENLDNNTKAITISTTVVFHNWFGRLYFLFVKPFHKIIVGSMLKSILKDLNKTT